MGIRVLDFFIFKFFYFRHWITFLHITYLTWILSFAYLVVKRKIFCFQQQSKRPDKSTTSYAMLDFDSDIEHLKGKYLLIKLKILHKYVLDLQ